MLPCRYAAAALLLSSLFTGAAVFADNALDNYIREGLANNLSLQAQKLQVEKRDAELAGARGRLLPTLTFHSRYTRANGGRKVVIPVSDMLNPIYEALNLITPGAPYPTNLGDETLALMPQTDQETKITIALPLLMPRLYHAINLQKDIKQTAQWELTALKRHLTEQIKIGYYTYLKSLNLLQVYEEMEDLLKENLRVSEKLQSSGRSTEDAVYRAQAELAEMAQKRLAASRGQQNAAAYLNYLVHRPLSQPVPTTAPAEIDTPTEIDLDEALGIALASREEIHLLTKAMDIEERSRRIALSGRIPELSTAFDCGFQGNDFTLSEDTFFWSLSVVGSWRVFDGLQNRYKNQAANIEMQRLALQLTETKERIKLEVEESHNNLLVARAAISAAAEQQLSSRKSYTIVAKKYEQGVTSQIEYLDAQTRLTNAEIASLTARYDYLIQYARFETVACLYQKDLLGHSTARTSEDTEEIE